MPFKFNDKAAIDVYDKSRNSAYSEERTKRLHLHLQNEEKIAKKKKTNLHFGSVEYVLYHS